MAVASVSEGIRAFRSEDIGEVAELHRRVFGTAEQPSAELSRAYQDYFTQIFLGNEWRDEDTHSLVYEERGKVIGFIGAVTLRMSFQGRVVRVKVGSQAIVEPARRGVAGLQLYGAFLESAHDLFIGDEANPPGRQIWSGFGGVTLLPYSLYWLYPLRPCKAARSILARKRLAPGFLLQAAAPVGWAIDRIAAPVLRRLSGRATDCVLFEEELTCEALLGCLALLRERAVRPVYDRQALDRILRRVAGLHRYGALQRILLRTGDGEIAGWYVYYLNPNGISEVLQLHANPGFSGAVVEHLIRHADSRGAGMLRGRADADLLDALSSKHALLRFGPPWAVAYSTRPELLQAFRSGDAFFSRLEGEWRLHFQ